MSQTNDQIVRNLPYLRRYARALLGSQTRGDHYVRVCLETLLEEPERIARGSRQELFSLFHEIWARLGDKLEAPEVAGSGSVSPFETHVLNLPPQERQVLLLTAVEGFAIAEAADILGVDVETAEVLLATARDDLAAQTAADVLIIEDEPMVAFDIADIVTEMGHTVIGTVATKDEAVVSAKARRPGVILADIKLADGSSGIDAVSDILTSMTVPVVFVTAYPERLLTGERTEPTFLVTKPFDPDTLKVTLHQALLSAGDTPSRKAVNS